MLGLQIGDEFLELPKGMTLELIEECPFLAFADDELGGSRSLPFGLNSIPPNVKATDYVAVFQKIVDNVGKQVRLYSNGQQHSTGVIKTEKVLHNLNDMHAGNQSHYYLFGSSSFYQEVKNKKLREINVGGDRSFGWDNYATSGSGFWGHITTVARSAPNFDDYAIFPVINKGWTSETNPTSMDVMNNVANSAGAIVLPNFVSNGIPGSEFDIKRIVPFPYLHYVMKKAVEYAGWTIEGNILNDADFLKITMLNAQAIDWGYPFKSSGLWVIGHRDPVVFNLQDNLPDIGIGEFLRAIRKRFGLWYNFDYIRKKIIVTKLDDLTYGEAKDMTAYASPAIPRTISQDNKIYALRNEFAIDMGEAPDLSNVYDQGRLDEFSDLPAPAEALYAQVYLIVGENNYYICLQNIDTGNWEWELFAPNIYDHAPNGSTDDVPTAATTIGMEKYSPQQSSSFPLNPLYPRLDVSGRWFGRTDSSTEEEWGIHLCFFHGTVTGTDGKIYPYGSSHIYDPLMNQVAQWALTYHCFKTDGTDVGLYEIFWKRFLKMVSSPEAYDVILYLPLYLALQLKFSDKIIIAGVKMFIKQKKVLLEYDPEEGVEVEALRIF